MTQPRIWSLAETCASIAIGFVVSVGLTAVLMPAYGHDVSLADNLQITSIFTLASVVRGYCVRRLFLRMGLG